MTVGASSLETAVENGSIMASTWVVRPYEAKDAEQIRDICKDVCE